MRSIISVHSVRVLALIGLLCAVLAAGSVIVARQVIGESTSTSSRLVATSSGIEISLDSFSLTPDQSDFDFTVQLPEQAIHSSDEAILDLPNTGTELLLTNVSPHRSGTVGSSTIHQPGMISSTVRISLGPIIDPGQHVELTITRLTFNIRDDEGSRLHQVDGEWKFRISSADVQESLKPRMARTVDRVLVEDGVGITIERMEKGSDGLTVYWSVSANQDTLHPAGLGLHLIMEDGSMVEQTRMATISEVDWPVPTGETARFSSTFPVVPASEERVTIAVDPFVVRLEASASAVIMNPLDEWSTDSFIAAGESFEVTRVVAFPDGNRILDIEISNTTPLPEATAMFMGVGTKSPRVHDETGREYPILSASTGMRRSDNGEMGAGTTTLTIAIPDDADPSRISIVSPEMGKLLRGPWTTEVQVP